MKSRSLRPTSQLLVLVSAVLVVLLSSAAPSSGEPEVGGGGDGAAGDPYVLRLSPELTLRWGLDYDRSVLAARVSYRPQGGVWESGAVEGEEEEALCPGLTLT